MRFVGGPVNSIRRYVTFPPRFGHGQKPEAGTEEDTSGAKGEVKEEGQLDTT